MKKISALLVGLTLSTSALALYVGKFKNVEGSLVDLAFSTEQTSSEGLVPEKYAFLLNADKKGEAFVADIIRKGLSGTDNNIGRLDAISSKFNYYSVNKENTLEVSTELSDGCEQGRFCNPPELPVCRYGEGEYYKGCKRDRDVTIVRKLAGNKLVSERTASQYGNPVNNYSFYLPAISSVCVWEKQ